MAAPIDPRKGINAWQAMGFVWDVLFSITVPTVLFALGGRWLDQRWKTSPLFLVLGLVLSLGVAGLLVYRKAERLKVLLSEPPKS
jgi:F0F1-type ATP synthase assembly protein I